MKNITRKPTVTLSLILAGTLLLAACSPANKPITATDVSQPPVVATSQAPTPSASAQPGVDGTEWDASKLPVNYIDDLSDYYDAEVLANLESDANSYVHMFNGSYFSDFINPPEGDNAEIYKLAVFSMQPYFLPDAYTSFEDSVTNGLMGSDPNLAVRFFSLMPLTSPLGEYLYASGESAPLDNSDSSNPPVWMFDNPGDTAIVIGLHEGGGVEYSRYITVNYRFADGRTYYMDTIVSYVLLPDANDHWVISDWERTVEYMGWVE